MSVQIAATTATGTESVRSIFLPPEMPGNRVSAYGAICSAVGRVHGVTLNWENTVQQKCLALIIPESHGVPTVGVRQARDAVFGKGGINTLNGLTGRESIPVLEKAIASLGDETDPDYWAVTDGNAKKPLYQLLTMAQMRPDGIWEVA